MRLDEFISRFGPDDAGRVVDATPAELYLSKQLAHLPGAKVVPLDEAGELCASDLLVVHVPVEDGADLRTHVARALDGLPPGASAILVVGRPPSTLPAGPVVDAIAAAGLLTSGAVGVGVGTGLTAVSVRRPVDPAAIEELGPLRSYPDGRPVGGPGPQAWLRLLAERAVESVVARTRDERLAKLEVEVESLTARLNAAVAASAKERKGRESLEHSRAMAVGRALAGVRSRPLRGLPGLVGSLRREPAPPAQPAASATDGLPGQQQE
jgi:hypothetical protein